MKLDAIIVADFDTDSFSGSNPLRLQLGGQTANIQLINQYVRESNETYPIATTSWSSAYKANGLFLYSFLTSKGLNVGLINDFASQKEHFCEYLKGNPSAVIISTTFITNNTQFKTLVSQIRSVAPDIFIIAGGSYVYSSFLISNRYKTSKYMHKLRQDFLFLEDDDSSVDLYLVHPTSFCLLPEVLKQTRQSGVLQGKASTSDSTCNGKIEGIIPVELHSHQMEWAALPPSVFASGVIPMEASNGCTSRCAFCNFVKEGRKNTVKDIAVLGDELRAVTERGARYVWFVDDYFRLGKDITSFCHYLLSTNLRISWMTFIRADALVELDVELLRRAGCKEVQLGLESADQKILRNMNKKASSSTYKTVIERLLEAGIDCTCYFIFGFPGETEATVKGTIDFINNINADNSPGCMFWSIYPFILAPLSPIFEEPMRLKYGLTGYMHDWEHETMNSKTARSWIKYAFDNIYSSTPVYRGDDLDLLDRLSPELRKAFYITRHKLAKEATDKNYTVEEIKKNFNHILTSLS